MLHVNDDMDELFRKAAEDYPLNTDGSDFDKVLSKLPNTSNKKDVDSNKRGYKRYLLLLLLLPFGFALNHYYNPYPHALTEVKQVDNNNAVSINKEPETTKASGNIEPETPKASGYSNGKKETELFIEKDNHALAYDNTQQKQHHHNASSSKPILVPKHEGQRGSSSPFKNKANDRALAGQEDPQSATSTTDNDKAVDELKKETSNEKGDVRADIEKPADNTAAKKTEANLPKSAEPGKKEESNKSAHLYAGFIGGLDISSVKNQQVNTTGFNAGLIVGYRLNKRVSAEALVLFDKKSYFTDAKHFDNSKANLPYFIALKTIEGDCKMIEIATNLKYDFKVSEKAKGFSTAGVSSYLMKRENYEYYYAGNTIYTKEASYNSSSKHWFAIVNVGVGYERSISNKTTIRFEPYFKLPLNGVGIGKLPITSTGINVGITRRIN